MNAGDNSDGPLKGAGAAYWILFLQGLGNLFPFNTFITATNYFTMRFCGTFYERNFENYFSIMTMISQVLGLLISLRYLTKFPIKYCVLIPVAVSTIVMILSNIFVSVTTISQWVLFVITLMSCSVIGLNSAVSGGGIFGLSGCLPPEYTGAVMCGQGMGGVVVSLVSISTIYLTPPKGYCITQESISGEGQCEVFVDYSAKFFFATCCAVLVLCFLSFYALTLLPFTRFYQERVTVDLKRGLSLEDLYHTVSRYGSQGLLHSENELLEAQYVADRQMVAAYNEERNTTSGCIAVPCETSTFDGASLSLSDKSKKCGHVFGRDDRTIDNSLCGGDDETNEMELASTGYAMGGESRDRSGSLFSFSDSECTEEKEHCAKLEESNFVGDDVQSSPNTMPFDFPIGGNTSGNFNANDSMIEVKYVIDFGDIQVLDSHSYDSRENSMHSDPMGFIIGSVSSDRTTSNPRLRGDSAERDHLNQNENCGVISKDNGKIGTVDETRALLKAGRDENFIKNNDATYGSMDKVSVTEDADTASMDWIIGNQPRDRAGSHFSFGESECNDDMALLYQQEGSIDDNICRADDSSGFRREGIARHINMLTSSHSSSALLSSATNSADPRNSRNFTAVFSKIYPAAMSIYLTLLCTLSVFPSLIVLIKSQYYCQPDTSRWRNDLFTPLLFLLYNISDLCGRTLSNMSSLGYTPETLWKAVWTRFTLIPLFLVCRVESSIFPLVFEADIWPMLFTLLFGLSNGFVSTLAMMFGPSMVSVRNSPLAGSVMVLALNIGLLCGSILSFLGLIVSA